MKHLFVPMAMLFLGIALFSTCSETKNGSQESEAGIQKYYYPEGPLYMEVQVRDSIPHGYSKEYFRDGKIFQETVYVGGLQHGLFRRYYEDGKLSLECMYDSGRRHGIEKKFRKDGSLAYEAPYHYDQPMVGLKEYYTDGTLVKKYPSLIIKEENRMDEYRFSLLLSLTDSYQVQYFMGPLKEGKFLSSQSKSIPSIAAGTGRLDYAVTAGDFLMRDVSIIARVKTDLGNYYLIEKSYNIAVDNR